MEYIISFNTDKGIVKSVNQDGLLIKVAKTKIGRVALFVVCDGLGGLEKGEVASSTVIRELANWYDNKLYELINEKRDIINSLKETIYELNRRLLEYSNKNKVKLGTTLTALFAIEDEYEILHIGDCRVYNINNSLKLLTKDQTLVEREIDRGNLTREEARINKKRNILLQCIGASINLEPVITKGKLERDSVYIICSDGLYHELLEDEFIKYFNPSNINSKENMDYITKEVVELVKNRGERDNITILLIKTI